MTIKTKELIDAIAVVTDNHNIRVTLKSSLKASAIVAGTTFLGGIIMGPIGILAGATTGGLMSYNLSKGSFKSAVTIIRYEMTEHQKQKLCDHVVAAFSEMGPQDIAVIIPMILSSNGVFQKMVITEVVKFLTTDMQLQIID